MNYFYFSVLIVSTIILIILLAIFSNKMIIAKKVHTKGFQYFRIDVEKNTIVKLSSNEFSNVLNIDHNTSFSKNHYNDLDSFINFFDDKTSKLIDEYLKNDRSNRILNIYGYLSKNNEKNNPFTKTLKKMNIDINNSLINIKMFPLKLEDNKVLCSIQYEFKRKDFNHPNFKLVLGADNFIRKQKEYEYFTSVLLDIKKSFFTKKINDEGILSILEFLELMEYEGFLYQKNGILQIVIPRKNIKDLIKLEKLLLTKIKNIQKNNISHFAFSNISLISNKAINSIKELDKYNDKCKYLIYNKINYPKNSKFNEWTLDNKNHSESFNDFLELTKMFEDKNEFKEYIKETVHVKNIDSRKKINIQLLKNNITGISNENLEFLKNIYFYEIIYANKWNQFLIDNIDSESTVILKSNTYDLINNKYDLPKSNVKLVFLLNNKDIDFDFDVIQKFNKENQDKNIEIGLYLDKIDNSLASQIHKYKIKYLIIGETITSKIEIDTDLYLNLYNLIKSIDNTNIVIYEKLNSKINNYYLEKLQIKYKIEKI
ncbi:MHO_4530 family protein [Mycoplasma sp. Mirounga ES2805-ORL]|uniref:MHO_4530 family protein n=1 Tax=Mycoplasma sp. Mirounga ES2805-ORL TaxID=754514 RepID=UPI00197C35AD|nr:hypothetical protein [Mycoplasma sp. Mirounga ES2805-ORL]QSF13875.1 hypothetical protein JXZ90_01065 [Mycoplasma sp. Mirounga ES2805-ORL]